MNTGELLQLLELPGDPTTGQVRVARRRIAKRLHPDAHGGRLERAMAEVNAGCDRLIADIRRRRSEPVVAEPAPAPPIRVDNVRGPVEFRFEYAISAAFVVLLGFMSAVLVVRSSSAAAIAFAVLVSAILGLAFIGTLIVLLRRR